MNKSVGFTSNIFNLLKVSRTIIFWCKSCKPKQSKAMVVLSVAMRTFHTALKMCAYLTPYICARI